MIKLEHVLVFSVEQASKRFLWLRVLEEVWRASAGKQCAWHPRERLSRGSHSPLLTLAVPAALAPLPLPLFLLLWHVFFIEM